jgi:hypothetical protein
MWNNGIRRVRNGAADPRELGAQPPQIERRETQDGGRNAYSSSMPTKIDSPT